MYLLSSELRIILESWELPQPTLPKRGHPCDHQRVPLSEGRPLQGALVILSLKHPLSDARGDNQLLSYLQVEMKAFPSPKSDAQGRRLSS